MFPRLLLLFIIVPIIELSLFMLLGKHLGLPSTLLIIIITAFIGASLTKSQGGKALVNFQNAMAQGQMPHKEIVDGLRILIAGAVLLTPGFLTDAIGFLLLLPPARAIIRKTLSTKLADKVNVSTEGPPLDEGFGEQSNPSKPAKTRVIDV